jgi:hypothetical protein
MTEAGAKQQERRAFLPNATQHVWDEVRIITVPRYKTSYASGDEWRTSLNVCYYLKGVLLYQYENWWPGEERNLAQIFEQEAKYPHKPGEVPGQGELCDQAGCVNTAVTTYKMRRAWIPEVFPNGAVIHNSIEVDPYGGDDKRPLLRKFCSAHSTRGDCSRSDCDENYELMAGPSAGPVDPSKLSPSATMYLYVDSSSDDYGESESS